MDTKTFGQIKQLCHAYRWYMLKYLFRGDKTPSSNGSGNLFTSKPICLANTPCTCWKYIFVQNRLIFFGNRNYVDL